MSERDLLAKQIKGLSIFAKEKVASFLEGNRRSIFRGSGSEFIDLREYAPGDEMRSIDWKATAKRPEVLIVREYELERNTNVVLLLDASASMLLGKKNTRINMAVHALASLTHAAIKNKDLIGFGAYSENLDLFISPNSGKQHEFFIYKQLLSIIPSGKTDIGKALKKISTTLKRRSLILVISDLHDNADSALSGFKIARAFKHEVLLLQITDAGEFTLPDNTGKVKYLNPSSSKQEVIDLSNEVTRGIYNYHIYKTKEKLNDFKRSLRALRVKIISCTTDDLIEKVLLSYFHSKIQKY